MVHEKKIAVLTSFYINNYGSILQAKATSDFINKLGYDVFFIDYTRENIRNRSQINEKWNKNILKILVYKIYKTYDNARKKKVFNDYIKTHVSFSEIEYRSKEELFKDPPKADVYCVGSDQMWNSEYNGGVIGENFLDFAMEGTKKISFSTSMGMSSFSDKELNQMKCLLKDFSFISVRENEAKDILLSLGFKDIHQIIDPTLLISGNEWKRNLHIKEKRKDYVLIYQLNDNPDMQNFARRLAKQDKIEVKQVTYYMSQHWDGIKSIYNPTIENFVSLIANAKYIVTDSFHGTAFSINFEKEFFSFSPNKYAGRISSLLSLTGLESRFVQNSSQYVIPGSIDYKSVRKILDQCRKEAEKLLKNALM